MGRRKQRVFVSSVRRRPHHAPKCAQYAGGILPKGPFMDKADTVCFSGFPARHYLHAFASQLDRVRHSDSVRLHRRQHYRTHATAVQDAQTRQGQLRQARPRRMFRRPRAIRRNETLQVQPEPHRVGRKRRAVHRGVFPNRVREMVALHRVGHDRGQDLRTGFPFWRCGFMDAGQERGACLSGAGVRLYDAEDGRGGTHRRVRRQNGSTCGLSLCAQASRHEHSAHDILRL